MGRYIVNSKSGLTVLGLFDDMGLYRMSEYTQLDSSVPAGIYRPFDRNRVTPVGPTIFVSLGYGLLAINRMSNDLVAHLNVQYIQWGHFPDLDRTRLVVPWRGKLTINFPVDAGPEDTWQAAGSKIFKPYRIYDDNQGAAIAVFNDGIDLAIRPPHNHFLTHVSTAVRIYKQRCGGALVIDNTSSRLSVF